MATNYQTKLAGIVSVLLFTMVFFANAAVAANAPIKLKAVSFINTNTDYAKCFVDYINRVNKKAKGKIEIQFLGGPEVIPAREQVHAVQNGTVDLVISPNAYQLKKVPESQIWSISGLTPWEERKNGLFNFLSGLYLKANMKLLASTGRGSKMYFFLKKEIKRPQDLKGVRVRTIPNLRTILEKLQCRGVVVPRSDIYVAMERGIIDGFLSPTDLVLELGQQEVTKYWIDKGFLVSVETFLMNVKRWNTLPKDVQDIMVQTAMEVERDYYPRWFAIDKKAKEALVKAGVKKIVFTPEDTKSFMQIIYKGFISDLERTAPNNIANLKKLLGDRVFGK